MVVVRTKYKLVGSWTLKSNVTCHQLGMNLWPHFAAKDHTRKTSMNIFLLLGLIFFFPLALLVGWLVLSSCMGDSVRARVAGVPLNVRHAAYGKTYLRNFGSAVNQGGFEQIEMENMMDPSGEYDERLDDEDEHAG